MIPSDFLPHCVAQYLGGPCASAWGPVLISDKPGSAPVGPGQPLLARVSPCFKCRVALPAATLDHSRWFWKRALNDTEPQCEDFGPLCNSFSNLLKRSRKKSQGGAGLS